MACDGRFARTSASSRSACSIAAPISSPVAAREGWRLQALRAVNAVKPHTAPTRNCLRIAIDLTPCRLILWLEDGHRNELREGAASYATGAAENSAVARTLVPISSLWRREDRD